MNNPTSLQHHETNPQNKQQDDDQQEEDALSLSDLALTSDEPERNNDDSPIKTHHHHQRSSSQPPDVFEFSNDLIKSDNLSHAEDIIHGGKLIPFKQHSIFDDQLLILSRDYDSTNFTRRFCESLPAARSDGYADNTRLKRSSRSVDRKKLRRNSSLVMKSEASDIHRSPPARSEAPKGGKPKWYDLILGTVKFPAEMDLRDMKNRQVRRNPGSMFAAVEGGDETPARSWGHDLLRVLSCKNDPSGVAVTASIRLVPQL